jgi:GTP-binding protein Era
MTTSPKKRAPKVSRLPPRAAPKATAPAKAAHKATAPAKAAHKATAPAKAAHKTTPRASAKHPPTERRPTGRATRAGFVAIVGRPNVGKSTLMNRLVGEPLAIVSRHPQTTRDRIVGIAMCGGDQLVFVDTPGMHEPRTRLGTHMNYTAEEAARTADVTLLVLDASRMVEARSGKLEAQDARVLASVPRGSKVIGVLNKVDRVRDKGRLLPVLEWLSSERAFSALVPASGRTGEGLDALLDEARALLPESPPLFPESELSDRPARFFVAELVREQVLEHTRAEVPHGVAVSVDAFQTLDGRGERAGSQLARVIATVHVDKESHKPIVLGKGGAMIKAIGTAARARVERLLGHRVHLELRVRVTPGWYEDEAALRELGYDAAGAARTDSTKATR